MLTGHSRAAVRQAIMVDRPDVPLKGVTAKGRLEGLLFELDVEQRYANESEHAIEAVFTFPLPLAAVLLAMEVDIAGQVHKARVIEKKAAARTYERAIDEGHAAVLLEDNGNGLYTVSVGNVRPGESVVVRYRFAELLNAHRGQVRLTLPTTIAPRYGAPGAAGLSGPSVPESDFLAEYPFDLSLDVVGGGEALRLNSPSHRLDTYTDGAVTAVRLAEPAWLDRDVVIHVNYGRAPEGVLVARDGDGFVALASTIPVPDTDESQPLSLIVLVDCSGSMQGQSIVQARRAVLQILDSLRPGDRINVIRFGSTVEPISDGLEPADEHSLPALRLLVRGIQADLGGTEMRGAIEFAQKQVAADPAAVDLLLVTDGEVHAIGEVLNVVAASRRRMSVVAIGAAPNEALARKVAAVAKGSCEFVSAGEEAAAAMLRTFKRLRAQPRRLTRVGWSQPTQWQSPLPEAVYPDDGVHQFAGFAAQPRGEVEVEVSGGNALAMLRRPIGKELHDSDVIPRLAAAARLPTLPVDQALALALRYQLVSPLTSMVVVAERSGDDQLDSLPVTQAVPQMYPSGAAFSEVFLQSPIDACLPSLAEYERPMFSNRSRNVDHELSLGAPYPRKPVSLSVEDRARLADALVHSLQNGASLPTTLAELEALGYPGGNRSAVESILATESVPEAVLVSLLAAMCLEMEKGDTGVALVRRIAPGVADALADRFLRSLRKKIKAALL